MFTFPHRLLPARTQKTRLTGQVVSGGRSLTGVTQVARLDGGGFWRTELADILLGSPDMIRCARAWGTHLDGGAQAIVMPVWDLAQAPRPWIAGRPAEPGEPEPVEDYFAQEPGFGAPLMSVRLAADADLRATTVSLQVDVGERLRGGEHFSLEHDDISWRLHRIMRIAEIDGATYEAEIRPPLRAAVEADMPAEFDMPRCVMRMTIDSADSFEPTLEPGGVTTISAAFEETFA